MKDHQTGRSAGYGFITVCCFLIISSFNLRLHYVCYSISVFTLLVEQQEGHPIGKDLFLKSHWYGSMVG